MEELPLFDVTIDPEFQKGENELGMTEIAFTGDPAILVKGVAFKSHKKTCFADNKKYRITAPAMIPMDIYRSDEDGEYEVRFTPEVIEEVFVKFMKDLKNTDLFNLEHEGNDRVPAYILEAWLVDNPKEDKAYSTFGLDVPKGTLMLTTQVTDKDYYNELVENDQLGYSIEAFLALKEPSKFNKHNNMELPNGKFTLDGKEYEVKDGQITEVELSEVATEEVEATAEASEEVTQKPKEVEAELSEVPKEEEMMQPKEEEMATPEEVTEEVVEEVENAIDPEVDAEAVKAIVQPMFDEILSLIAEIKEEMGESAEEAPVEDAEVRMSASQKFNNAIKFLRNE